MTDHHVVMFSSGAGSAVAGKRAAERYGIENTTLLFADVGEDEDNYRFLKEAQEWVGAELVVLDNDGKTIWDVFRESRFLGNTRIDPCSRVLKREPMRAWLEENFSPDNTVVHLGFDVSEEHRIKRAAPFWEPWKVDAPLCWEPPLFKDQVFDILTEAGIEIPLLSRQGFSHANCRGGCVKAGMAQFKMLLEKRPEVYADWEREEQDFQKFIQKDVTILRDRRGGEVKPLSLAAFRERLGVDPHDYDAADHGSCNCMGNWDVEVPQKVSTAARHARIVARRRRR